MHSFLINKVIQPTILAISELCEKHGISFICYIEHVDGMVSDSLTHSIQADATDQMKNTLKAAEGKLK